MTKVVSLFFNYCLVTIYVEDFRQPFVSFHQGLLTLINHEQRERSLHLTLQSLNLKVLVRGNRFLLIDARGNRLSKWLRFEEIATEPDDGVLLQWRWKFAIYRLQHQINGKRTRASQDPWQTKIATLKASFRFRSFDLHRPRTRGTFDRYPTSTWEAAIHRLWQQGHNHHRYHSRSGWTRWSSTVANNHNKRKGGRYAASRYGHCQSDS